MTKKNRNKRVTRRGHPELWRTRNRKVYLQYERWYRGVMVREVIDVNTAEKSLTVNWEFVPTGRGLIHKGRKP